MSNTDSIKAKLKKMAVADNKQYDYLLMLYFIERLLYRISISRYESDFVLKGGLLLYTILDEKARATKDVDLLARETANTLENLKRIFIDICQISANDGVVFDISTIKAERIKEDADYEGVRIKINAFLDKSKKVLQFDIGFGDVIVPKAMNIEYPSLLDMERPKLKAYSMESVIAEKFEAMIYLSDANSRMKDFYDIFSLCSVFNFDGRVLYEAINQTFIRRATPLSKEPTIFSEKFATDLSKQVQWNAFKNRINSKTDKTFEEIMCVITVFTKPIYDCVINENEFFGYWNYESCYWE